MTGGTQAGDDSAAGASARDRSGFHANLMMRRRPGRCFVVCGPDARRPEKDAVPMTVDLRRRNFVKELDFTT